MTALIIQRTAGKVPYCLNIIQNCLKSFPIVLVGYITALEVFQLSYLYTILF